MSAEPRVTIAFPIYKARADLLLPALDAARAQTFGDVELFVVDDGSDEEVLRAVEARGVRVYRNATRQGLAGNWNRCLGLARGELINIAHQDDRMYPAFIARAVEALDRAPRAGFVHTGWRAVDDGGNPTGERWAHLAGDHGADFVRDGRDYFARIVGVQTTICCPTAVYRRAVFERCGGFDEQFRFAADLELFCRVLLQHDVAYVAEVLLDYRRHQQSTTSEQGWAQIFTEVLRAKRRALEVAGVRGALPKDVVARLEAEVAQESCRRARRVALEDPDVAALELREALRLCPRVALSEGLVVGALRVWYARARRSLGLGAASRTRRRDRDL